MPYLLDNNNTNENKRKKKKKKDEQEMRENNDLLPKIIKQVNFQVKIANYKSEAFPFAVKYSKALNHEN